MVAIPRGSTAYKVAARQSAPSGELPSDRQDEPQPVQSQYHLTRGSEGLDSSRQPSKKRERDIDEELDIESSIQEWTRCLAASKVAPSYNHGSPLPKSAHGGASN